MFAKLFASEQFTLRIVISAADNYCVSAVVSSGEPRRTGVIKSLERMSNFSTNHKRGTEDSEIAQL